MCFVARTEAIIYVVIKWNYKWWKPKSACNNFMNEITQRKKWKREKLCWYSLKVINPCFCFLKILSQLSRLLNSFIKDGYYILFTVCVTHENLHIVHHCISVPKNILHLEFSLLDLPKAHSIYLKLRATRKNVHVKQTLLKTAKDKHLWSIQPGPDYQ